MRDDEWNEQARGETATERLDRNWSNLLQELRVVQTGIQLLTGFLLTLPFQDRFVGLGGFEKTLYLITLASSALATVLLVGPVALHRLLFRRHALAEVVTNANRLAIVGFALLGVAMSGVVMLIFDVVVGFAAGIVAGVLVALIAVTVWLVVPLLARRRHPVIDA